MDKNACNGCPRKFEFKESAEFNPFVEYANFLLKMEKKIMYGIKVRFNSKWDEYFYIPVKDELEKSKAFIASLKRKEK